MSQSLCRIEKISVKRGELLALNEVSFEILHAERIALVGSNGSGKSTLLRALAGLERPCTGTLAWANVQKPPVGLIFQTHNLVPSLTVLTNVIHGALKRYPGFRTWYQAIAPDNVRAEAMEVLSRVGLADLALRKAGALSGGQSQRVAIARALMQHPTLLLADEATASLDPEATTEIMELLTALPLTIVFTTHELSQVFTYATRVIGLQRGALVLDGTPNDAKSQLQEGFYG